MNWKIVPKKVISKYVDWFFFSFFFQYGDFPVVADEEAIAYYGDGNDYENIICGVANSETGAIACLVNNTNILIL